MHKCQSKKYKYLPLEYGWIQDPTLASKLSTLGNPYSIGGLYGSKHLASKPTDSRVLVLFKESLFREGQSRGITGTT